MKCLKCGAELKETDTFCPNCGAKVQRGNSNGTVNNNEFFTYERPGESAQNNNIEFNNLQNGNNNQQNYNQRNYNQPNNNQSNNLNAPQQNPINYGVQQPKKKSKAWIAVTIIVVLIIALLIGGIVFIVRKVNSAFSNKSIWGSALQGTLGDSSYNGLSDELLGAILSEGFDSEGNGTVLNITSGNNDSVKLDKDNAEQIDFEGFRFYIPNNLEQSVNEKSITIKDTDNQWLAILTINEGDLIDEIQDDFIRNIIVKGFNSQQDDIRLKSSAKATLNGVDYILFEGERGGETLVLAFAKLNSEYMITGCLIASDGNLALSTVSEIIKNAEPIDQ